MSIDHPSIKARALADFLVESVRDKKHEQWIAYDDRSSNNEGSGVVVLISPQGEEIKLAVRLTFKASNNIAEYEALLTALRAARNVGVEQILINMDS